MHTVKAKRPGLTAIERADPVASAMRQSRTVHISSSLGPTPGSCRCRVHSSPKSECAGAGGRSATPSCPQHHTAASSWGKSWGLGSVVLLRPLIVAHAAHSSQQSPSKFNSHLKNCKKLLALFKLKVSFLVCTLFLSRKSNKMLRFFEILMEI